MLDACSDPKYRSVKNLLKKEPDLNVMRIGDHAKLLEDRCHLISLIFNTILGYNFTKICQRLWIQGNSRKENVPIAVLVRSLSIRIFFVRNFRIIRKNF